MDATPGCARENALIHVFMTVCFGCASLDLFCPADHVSGAKQLFCAGTRKLRLDNQSV